MIRNDDSTRSATLLLSPHYDDAALSLGASLDAGALPAPVHILTTFGLSNYVRGEFRSDQRHVTLLRREEERRYAQSVGAVAGQIDFLEAGLRIGSNFDALFKGASSPQSRKPDNFDGTIEGLILSMKPRALLCPLGLGDHWDHILVREAVRQLHASFGANLVVLFYEELPYADDLGPEAVEQFARTLQPAWKPIILTGSWERKCAGLTCYPSQLGEEEVTRVRSYGSRLADRLGRQACCERLWTEASIGKLRDLRVMCS